MALVTSQATFTRFADGSVHITSVGGVDPILTADEGAALTAYLGDTAKALPDTQKAIDVAVEASEAAEALTEVPAEVAAARASTEVVLPAAGFKVAGFPSPSPAGTIGTFKVTALDTETKTDKAYAGTVTFASSGASNPGLLPGDYTFADGESGVHEFSATLDVAGTHQLVVTDTSDATITGSQDGIVVEAAATP